MRSRDTRPGGVAGKGILVPSSRLSSPRLSGTLGLSETTQGFAGPRSPLRRRLHSSWAQLRLTGRVPWGRGDPAQCSPSPSRPFQWVQKPLCSPFSTPAPALRWQNLGIPWVWSVRLVRCRFGGTPGNEGKCRCESAGSRGSAQSRGHGEGIPEGGQAAAAGPPGDPERCGARHLFLLPPRRPPPLLRCPRARARAHR